MSLIDASRGGNLNHIRGLLNSGVSVTNFTIKRMLDDSSSISAIKYVLDHHQGTCSSLTDIVAEMASEGYSDQSIMLAIDNLECDVDHVMRHLIANDRVELAAHLLRNDYVDRHTPIHVIHATNLGHFRLAMELIKAGATFDDCHVRVPATYLYSVLETLTK